MCAPLVNNAELIGVLRLDAPKGRPVDVHAEDGSVIPFRISLPAEDGGSPVLPPAVEPPPMPGA